MALPPQCRGLPYAQPPQSWTELLDFIAFYRAFSAAQQGSATAGSADGGTKGAAGGIPELPPYPLCLPVGVGKTGVGRFLGFHQRLLAAGYGGLPV